MKTYPKHKRIKLSRSQFKKLAHKAYIRDNFTCQWCGKTHPQDNHSLSPHHLKFVSAGGDDILRNLVSLCILCHGRLHDGHIPRDLKKP